MRPPSFLVIPGLFLLFVAATHGLDYSENLVTDAAVANKWVKAANEFDKIVFPQKDFVVAFLGNHASQLSLAPKCASALISLSKGLREKKFWAYQFLDSSARGRSGLASGYIADLGDFDGCLKIEKDDRGFGGNYCLVDVKFPVPAPPERAFLKIMKLNLRDTELKDTLYEFYGNHTELWFYESFTFAACMPSTCSVDDLTVLTRHAFSSQELKIQPRGSCVHESAFIPNLLSKPLDTQLCLLVVVIFSCVVAASTTINYFGLPGKRYADIFCAIRNTRKLTADFTDPAMKKMMFFDSFKCFFQVGGTFGHICCYMSVVPVMFATIQSTEKFMEEYWLVSEFLQKAIYITQVILVISGFFTSYYMIPVMEKTAGRLNFLSYAFKRWIRTAPATLMAICLLFAVSAISYGPLTEDLEKTYLNTCRSSWIMTVLQINNFFTAYDNCLPQTWTQSADFHLWLLAFYPLKVLATNPRKGVSVCLTLIGLGVVIPTAVTYVQALPSPVGSTRPFEIMFLIVRGSAFPAMALHTYNNIANYFIGVLVGYVCYKEIKVGPLYTALASMFLWGLGAACMYGPYIWQRFLGMTFSAVGNALYFGIFKVMFGLIFASNIYVVYFYMDSIPAAEITRSKFLTLLGRLSLSIYVSQLAPISYYMVMSYDPMPVNKYSLITRVLSIVIQCCATGYFTFLLVEAPFMNLTKGMGFKAVHQRHEVATQFKTAAGPDNKMKGA